MKRVLTIFAVTAVAISAVASAGWAQNPQAVLSWGTCTPQVQNANFGASATYQLVVSAKNLTAADANVGTDLTLYIGPNLPDAWRFDDSGCQTGSQVTLSTSALSKTCPALKGANSLTITNFGFEPSVKGGRMNVRLAITFDTFTPAPATQYTMWLVTFDHTFSAGVENDGDPLTCDGALRPLCITMSNSSDTVTPSVVLALTGQAEPFQFATPNDQFVTWNSAAGCPASTPAEPATWGKVKGMYR